MSFCPATMCPLFAAEGSIWTGTKRGECLRSQCGWWKDGKCFAPEYALEGVAEAPVSMKPNAFDCPYAAVCQWQLQSAELCAPRLALSLGKDPRCCQG